MSNSKTCTKCGKKIPANMKYCPFCSFPTQNPNIQEKEQKNEFFNTKEVQMKETPTNDFSMESATETQPVPSDTLTSDDLHIPDEEPTSDIKKESLDPAASKAEEESENNEHTSGMESSNYAVMDETIDEHMEETAEAEPDKTKRQKKKWKFKIPKKSESKISLKKSIKKDDFQKEDVTDTEAAAESSSEDHTEEEDTSGSKKKFIKRPKRLSKISFKNIGKIKKRKAGKQEEEEEYWEGDENFNKDVYGINADGYYTPLNPDASDLKRLSPIRDKVFLKQAALIILFILACVIVLVIMLLRII